jgi:hypothetical protein
MSALQMVPETRPLPAVGYQRLPHPLLPQFPPQPLCHRPPPRTSLMISSNNDAPMVALMTARTMPEPRCKLREKQAANESISDSDEEFADNPESGALHDLARQPSGNQADHQYDQETFTRHMHLCVLQILRTVRQNPGVFRERESHWLGWKRTLPVTRRGTTLLRHRSYHHTNRKTVQNCSTQKVCRFIHMSCASAKWHLVTLILGWSCRTIFNNAVWSFMS